MNKRIVCVFLYLYLPTTAADSVESDNHMQYAYIDADHQTLVRTTLDKERTPQELLQVLNGFDDKKKAALLNTAIIANEEGTLRCTTLVKELLSGQSTQNGEVNNNTAVKIQYLLEHGYKPNANLLHVTSDGTILISTLPLLDAVYMGNVEVTRILIMYGAKPDRKDLAIAMRSEEPEGSHSPRKMLEFCLENSLHVQNNTGDALLAPPASRNRYELIAQLFNK